MATDFTPAPQAAQQQYPSKYGFVPPHSGRQTPANISPTSPRTMSNIPAALHIHTPQVHPRQTPLYVPAALRKTGKPMKHSPPKADSVLNTGSTNLNMGSSQPVAGDNESIRSRLVPQELSPEEVPLSPIAGPITREHWKNDYSTQTCTYPSCDMHFSLFNRRHHCRKCGGIFCAAHSSKQVQLNDQALFHSAGDMQRACDTCYQTYREWQRLRSSRQNSASSSSTGAVNVDIQAKRPDAQRGSSMAASLGTWNWSTF